MRDQKTKLRLKTSNKTRFWAGEIRTSLISFGAPTKKLSECLEAQNWFASYNKQKLFQTSPPNENPERTEFSPHFCFVDFQIDFVYF